MKPPAFWFRSPGSPGLCARLLSPLSMLAARTTARRVARAPAYVAPVPVICIGNLHLGGTGKTPAVISLAQRLIARGVDIHVVSRGYGGSERGPLRVDPAHHAAARTGDEPLMIAAFCPVWVSKDRAAGVRAAVEAGAKAVLLDDGFQNPSVKKDAAVLCVNAAEGFGNGRVAPAGPLREPVAAGLARADLVLTIGDAAAQAMFPANLGGLPRVRAELRPLATGMDWAGMRVFAFAGIGRPERFFATLRDLGADVAGTAALADHQPINASLLRRLVGEAGQLGAQLVTTEKDAVRLPRTLQGQVMVVPVRLEPDNWAPLDALFARLGL